jgi:hypothetical protein
MAAQAVDQPESDKGKHQIGSADSDRLQERGLGAKPSELKYPGSKI